MEVLHRVHPSALLMMHTCCNLWGVSSWWHMKHVDPTNYTELDRDPPCSLG